jgi:hypothetical protein
VDDAQLALAKRVLEAFDLALVVEHFHLQGPSLMLQRVLGVGVDASLEEDEHDRPHKAGIWLGHARPNARGRTARGARADPPDAILRRLREENAWDRRLHAFAIQLSSRRMEELRDELEREEEVKSSAALALASATMVAKRGRVVNPFEEIVPSGAFQRRTCLRECRGKYSGAAPTVLLRHNSSSSISSSSSSSSKDDSSQKIYEECARPNQALLKACAKVCFPMDPNKTDEEYWANGGMTVQQARVAFSAVVARDATERRETGEDPCEGALIEISQQGKRKRT